MSTTSAIRATARVIAALGLTLALTPTAHAADFGPWSTAMDAELVPGTSDQLNTQYQDGCPIQSPDGLSLYLASNRPKVAGGLPADLDIWVAHRDSKRDPWGPPENLGAPINTAADEFCPTPVRGGGLFFVSRKVTPGVTCGQGDIYFTREHPKRGWREPEHLGCGSEGGPNGPADEQGPSYTEAGGGQLFYSGGPDIFVSQQGAGWTFGPPVAVAALNGPASDIQPNVRKDGLEIVFTSNDANRAGSHGANFDIYRSTRASLADAWSTPVNLGNDINTAAQETRPSLSWHATQLLFGRNPGPEGNNDIFVSVRTR